MKQNLLTFSRHRIRVSACSSEPSLSRTCLSLPLLVLPCPSPPRRALAQRTQVPQEHPTFTPAPTHPQSPHTAQVKDENVEICVAIHSLGGSHDTPRWDKARRTESLLGSLTPNRWDVLEGG
ncbi:hypothetical protein E2C01_054795 [Portunus trituberculatus]|uniref:Uncharacterized protein n=1 Tax=Portunus trituberculatus TaxID=210409 RepID=A0A5B7GSW6_PORTR|nr:hypothetical protein [Portunus trituberculatus]